MNSNELDPKNEALPETVGTEPIDATAMMHRRRFIGTSSAAIVASMASRPVLGTYGGHNCAPSGYASANLHLSNKVVGSCGGRSPYGLATVHE